MVVNIINIDKYANALSNHNLFNCFSQDQLNQLFSSTGYRINKYSKGTIIHFQNEACHTMDIILEGKASVQKIDKDGNILKINVLSDGEFFGANLLFSSRNTYPMTVISESDSVLLHLDKELIIELNKADVRFMLAFITAISDRTLVLTDKIDAISLKTIRQNIIYFLRYEYHLQKTNVIQLHISKKDLAERLGIQRTSLSRELNKMRKEGLLEYDARTITLKQIDFFL